MNLDRIVSGSDKTHYNSSIDAFEMTTTSLLTFQLQVFAKLSRIRFGYSIENPISIPNTTDSPTPTRMLRIVRQMTALCKRFPFNPRSQTVKILKLLNRETFNPVRTLE